MREVGGRVRERSGEGRERKGKREEERKERMARENKYNFDFHRQWPLKDAQNTPHTHAYTQTHTAIPTFLSRNNNLKSAK